MNPPAIGSRLAYIARGYTEMGASVKPRRFDFTLFDPGGTMTGGQGIYWSEPFTILHRSQPGVWRVEIKAQTAGATGNLEGSFQVLNSTREELLA